MNIRIGNIECRKTDSLKYEIVQWYPNSFYGKKQSYLDAGWQEIQNKYSKRWHIQKDSCIFEQSIFEHKESCYVVAFLEHNNNASEVDMHTVGSRLLKLNTQDLNSFMKVYRMADQFIIEELSEPQDQYKGRKIRYDQYKFDKSNNKL